MGVYIASFAVKGISPLLMNNPISMDQKSDGGVAVKKKYVATEEAEVRVYRDEKGAIYLPADAFRSALIQACSGRKLGKIAANRVIQSSVFNTDTRVYLTDPATKKPLKDYEIDTRRAIVNKQGILRSRPRFKSWGCTLDLEIDGDFIADPSPIEQLLNMAGKFPGVGDYRPGKKGEFGRFQVTVLKSTLQAA